MGILDSITIVTIYLAIQTQHQSVTDGQRDKWTAIKE